MIHFNIILNKFEAQPTKLDENNNFRHCWKPILKSLYGKEIRRVNSFHTSTLL